MSKLDGEKILRDLKDGRPGAFRKLVDLHMNRVLNTCYRFVRNKADAEEIAQDVFMEVHRGVADFRGDAALSTWIYRIAVARSLDFIRRRNRKKRFDSVRHLFGAVEEVERVPAPRGERPDAAAERQERYRVLWEALGSLPDNQRAAITLSKYDGFSQKEVAEIMGITVAAVESLIQRAKRRLRKRIEKHYRREA